MKGVIYRMFCKDSNITECYIGSTINLYDRKRNHKKAVLNPNDGEYKRKKYEFIRNNGGWDKWDFEILDEIEFKNKKELETLERTYIETIKPKLNNNIPLRTMKEYREANKEKRNAYSLEYNKKLKKKYTCVCGKTLTLSCKKRHEQTIYHLQNSKI
tara:strand:+ start:46 stop:516 length:471 start_codon:yes stop_codon:yes gene_type:complete